MFAICLSNPRSKMDLAIRVVSAPISVKKPAHCTHDAGYETTPTCGHGLRYAYLKRNVCAAHHQCFAGG